MIICNDAFKNMKYNIINTSGCNCSNHNDWLSQNNCQNNSLVYVCTVSKLENPNIKQLYIGSNKNMFNNLRISEFSAKLSLTFQSSPLVS